MSEAGEHERTATTRDVCGNFNINRKTLERWQEMGLPCDKTSKGNLYSIPEVAAWIVKNGRTGEPGKPHEPLTANREDAELRKVIAQAKNWEIRNAKLEADLLPADEVHRRWQGVAFALRAKLQAMPASVGPRMTGDDAGDIAELEDAVAEIVEALADDPMKGYEPDA